MSKCEVKGRANHNVHKLFTSMEHLQMVKTKLIVSLTLQTWTTPSKTSWSQSKEVKGGIVVIVLLNVTISCIYEGKVVI
jgi:hypothetical protein